MRLTRAGLLALLLLAHCANDEDRLPAAVPTASATSSADNALALGVLLPPEQPADANPLQLPSHHLDVEEGGRVFTVPAEMLRGAKLGSAMDLRWAKVLGREGDLVNLRIGTGKPFLAHPAYVVAPRSGKLRRGGAVFAAYGGRLRHGVLRHMSGRGAVIRFTDLGYRLGDQTLPREQVGVLPVGLAPGGYAVMRGEHAYEHVTLVSPAPAADKQGWFVLGRDGAARLVDEANLQVLPQPRARFRVGDEVLVAWHGSMVPAKIRSIDQPALFVVQRRRAGGSLVVGPGMIMPNDAP